MSQEIVVGVTGASGSIYAARLLRALELSPEVAAVHLVVSRHARVALREELGIPSSGPLDLARLVGSSPKKVQEHDIGAVEACISSGSYRTAGMAVVPCSMGTVARIAQGTSDSLLTRAADVCLKERRRLVLAVRETPLSLIHLRNLTLATEAGAVVMPAMPGFYSGPASIEDLVDHFLARLLDHFNLGHQLGRRWKA